VQRAAFAAQIALAHAHSLTLVIHARDAWDDLFDVLDAEGVPERAVLHCFTGGPAEVDRCLRAGLFVSFSGIITFKTWTDLELLRTIPDDRVLVESDAPYLAPVPHRGKRNEPSWVVHTIERLADARGVSPEPLADRCRENTERLFGFTSHPPASWLG